MVFYRKYRPQTIDDLDNSVIRETLFSVLKNPTNHAFLFTGPKGLGKTSTARIIAKVVNCEKKQEAGNKKQGNDLNIIEPCNQCEQCISITNGTNMDVLEIDAASNRGIDEIRELKEKIRLAPVNASKKVYIIDEVHMLTTEAFNALLKTLEEPPSHAMFILCTTEPHKIPATILSRCFHLTFKPAKEEELVRSFRRIVKAEKIEITDEALNYIASLSDKGFRDGVKILEELTQLAAGQEITKIFINEKYKTSNVTSLVQELLTVLQARKTKESLAIITQSLEQGIDTKYFLQQLIETLHGLFLSHIESKQSSQFTLDEMKILFELFSKAFIDTKFAVLPQLPLELAIIEYCQLSSVITRNEMVAMTNDKGITVSSLRKQVGEIKKNQALYGSTKQNSSKDESDESAISMTKVGLMQASPNETVTKDWLEGFWNQLISEMKRHNHTIAGVLRGCSIKSFDKKTLIIQTNYTFHKERLDDMKTRDILIKTGKLLTGKEIEVKVELRK